MMLHWWELFELKYTCKICCPVLVEVFLSNLIQKIFEQNTFVLFLCWAGNTNWNCDWWPSTGTENYCLIASLDTINQNWFCPWSLFCCRGSLSPLTSTRWQRHWSKMHQIKNQTSLWKTNFLSTTTLHFIPRMIRAL